MSMSASVISTLVIGVPSVIVAASSYVFATRAHREAVGATREQAKMEAYHLAKTTQEAITDLRRQVAELKNELSEVSRLRQNGVDLEAELAEVREQLNDAHEHIRALQDRYGGARG